MYKRWIEDYFSFTKKERSAVLMLVFLIVITAVLPALIPQRSVKIDEAALAQFQQELGELAPLLKDSFQTAYVNKFSAPGHHSENYSSPPPPSLFYFDPNTLSAAGWIKLGVREKTIQTIRHYLEKGGRFKKPEDITKIYGLRSGEAEKLLPYVRLVPPLQDIQSRSNQLPAYQSAYAKPYKPPYADLLIDINRTDTTTLQLLPGIGSKLAARIINFRDKLGGFYAVEQLAETFGLPDSTFQKIKPHLQAPSPPLATININTADAGQLKQHPYIRWNGANAIVQYRLQHGNFKTKEELLQVAIITPELFGKLSFYITVE